jgi:hypothetical protein
MAIYLPKEINVLVFKPSADDGNWEYDGDENGWKMMIMKIMNQ